MGDRFRLALVGAGMITQQSHLPAALASPLAEVAAIVDPVVARASDLARSFGLSTRIVPRVEDVLGDIDGAVIATPNDSHAEIAVACLKSGVSTLIEKPLASSYASGLEIVRAANNAHRIVAVGYSTRFRPSVLLLKRLLDEGYFGAVRRFVHQFGTPGGWAPLSSYILDRRTAGGGVLVVTGTHFIDRMLYLWGYPDQVSLEDDSEGGPEANCVAHFNYAHPAPISGMARYSKTFRLPGGMVIETDQGYVVLGDSDEADLVFRPSSAPGVEHVIRSDGSSSHHRHPPPSVFQQQIDDFIEACQTARAPRVDGSQGLESLRLIEELYGSRRGLAFDPYGQVTDRVSD